MKQQRKELLERIAAKGGLYGAIASFYVNSEYRGNIFLKECFDQCHNESVWKLWGKKLTMDIIRYRVDYLRNVFERSKKLPS